MANQERRVRRARGSAKAPLVPLVAFLLFLQLVAVIPTSSAEGDPSLTVDPASGVQGTSVTITGSGFAPGVEIALEWTRQVGSRVSPSGWVEETYPITTVTADASGGLSQAWAIPADLGGEHRILAVVGDAVAATADFTVTRSHSISPESGPAGTQVRVTILGAGWTEYDNVMAITYDNSYIGYVCGFYDQGNATFWFQATGAPGPHIVGILPALWNGPSGKDDGPTPWKLPMLNVGDLPVPFEPVFLTFTITGPGTDRTSTVASDLVEVMGPDSPVIPLAPAVATRDGTPRLALGNAARAFVGSDLPFELAGFPAGSVATFRWSTLKATVTIQADKFKGWPTTESTVDGGSVTVRADGTASGAIRIKDDYGGEHLLEVLVGGQVLADQTFRIITRFSAALSADGTSLRLHGTGLGATKYGSLFNVLYDGRLTGVISALTSDGTVDVSVPVVGTPGVHSVEIHSGANGFPYLTMWSSIFSYIPAHRFTFTIEDAAAPPAQAPQASLPLWLSGAGILLGVLAGFAIGRVRKREAVVREEPVTEPN